MAKGAALSPPEWLTLIAERAMALRQAGVESLTLDGCSVTLSKLEAAPTGSLAAAPEENSDPLFDAASYPGGKVPGYNLTGAFENETPEEDQS